MSIRHAFATTSLGELLLVAEGEALVGVYFEAHAHPPDPERIGETVGERQDALLARAASELREYLSGERRVFEVPVAMRGDAFSERVWELLRAIPYGSTTSYGALARELGGPGLAQRVGQAVGHNPISIIVPCHRVLGADGSLTGYAGGLDRKRALLALEEPDAADAGRLF